MPTLIGMLAALVALIGALVYLFATPPPRAARVGTLGLYAFGAAMIGLMVAFGPRIVHLLGPR